MDKVRSAKFTLWKTVLLFLVPFLIFLIFLNVSSNRMYRQRLAENNQTKIAMFESMLSEDIKNIEYFMSDMIANDGNYQALMYPVDDTESYLQTYQLGEKFESVMKMMTSVSGFVLLSPQNDLSSGTFRREISYERKEALIADLNQYISQNAGEVTPYWQVMENDGSSYFYKIMGNGGVYTACVIDARNISAVEENNGAMSYLLFEKDGNALAYSEELEELGVTLDQGSGAYISGNGGSHFIVRGEQEFFSCHLLSVEPYRPIWSAQTFPLIVVGATIVFMLLLVYCYGRMKRQFLMPLETLVQTMEQIREGELEKNLAISTNVSEYKKIESTFNSMMARMKDLKILAYDRLLQVQQTKMQYYQIQIRPHFFLNCMKNLYAMAAGKKYERLMEMILTLSQYLRVVLKDYSASVPLEKELEGVRTYISLLRMSNAHEIHYEEDLSGGLGSFLIPPMSILTFVENSFKYEKDSGEPVHILVKARCFEDGSQTFVNLTIMDNGSGFPDDVLELLNDPKQRLPGDHIGIYNVRQRFELLYQNTCSFVFSNMEGACVDIFVPVKEGEDNDRFNCG